MSARWDSYFMRICETVSSNTRCPARRLGAVVTRDNYVVSTGYNGPPSGFPHPGSERFKELAEGVVFPRKPDWALSDCTRRAMRVPSGEQLGLCPCAHAERNAIDAAARLGTSTVGCVIYLNSVTPCLDCAYSIINAGIVEVVVSGEDYLQPGFSGRTVLEESGVKVRRAEQEE